MPTPTSVRLEEWQRRALSDHGAKLDRSESWIIKLAVTRLLREEGYSPLDEQPMLPPAPPVPAPQAAAQQPQHSAVAVLEREQPALIERPAAKAQPKPEAKKPGGGWTPERRWKQNNLMRVRNSLPRQSFEEWKAENPQHI